MKKFITLILLFIALRNTAQIFNGATGKILNTGQPTFFNLSLSGVSPATIDSTFGVEEICLNISHPKVEQLYIYLQSPSGTVVELTDGSTCNGANYLNSCFNNTANVSITTGAAPFSGTYRPIGNLGRFNTSQAVNGTWVLIVKDYLAFVDSGSVINWSIKFGNSPPHPVVFNSSNLPIIEINTGGTPISGNTMLVNLGIVFNGTGQRNNITDPMNNYNAKAMIHIRGNSTRNFEKKCYSFESRDLNGIKFDASLLGMPLESDWELLAPYQDKSLIRIPLTYNLFRKMGHYSSRNITVELVINGEYQGIYSLAEKTKRGTNRINISKLNTFDNSGSQLTGGYIIKIDRSDSPGWPSLFPGNSPTNSKFFYQYDSPTATVITTQQKNYIKSVVDTFETVMNSSSYSNPINGYAKYIDVNSFIDYFIINELSKDVDAYRLSTFMYKENIMQGGKLHIGPVWDYDIAWHNCNYGNSFSSVGWEYQLPDSTSPCPTWWNKFMVDTNFVNGLYCRWKDLRQNILSINYLNNYIDSSATSLKEASQRNFIQWPVIGATIWPNPQSQVNATYQGEIADLKNWIVNRISWLDGAIAGKCLSVGINEYDLDNNTVLVYPNPVENTTTFSISLKQAANLNLSITDVTGKLIATVINEPKLPGEHKIVFSKNQLTPGIYFYLVKINNYTIKEGKIIIL